MGHRINSSQVVNRLKKQRITRQSAFIEFDVESFYPSISPNLVRNTINWARGILNITDKEIEIIEASCHNFLFNGGIPWEKVKYGEHDVTMGSYSGAELCEFVGLFILYQLRDVNINPILYRDDGLLLCNSSPKDNHKTGLKIIEIFKRNDLDIKLLDNRKITNFLDLTLDLNTHSYRIYVKENNFPLYVHSQSNHPQSILKNIPLDVERRVSNLCMTEQIFNECKGFF